MLKQLEGSRAVAETVALCRPEVVCAYPITPQTHIVEAVGEMVRDGTLAPCEFINVESEFSALSVAIGASAGGARTYTATASQGLLFMAEAVFNASGMGLPIVMTVANRAIGAPINIWNDQSDSMALRDSGWLQLYATSNQEAVDLHIIAFRLAEEISLPVMVCMDGFVLTHAYERVDIPEQSEVDAYLPRFEPRQMLDPAEPVTMGAMVGPEAFTEVRYLAHIKQMQALELLPTLAREFEARFGRDSGCLIQRYRTEDADTIIVALGSVVGTLQEVIDTLRNEGNTVGVLAIRAFRPFPLAEVHDALRHAKRVIVVERAFAIGQGGIVADSIRKSLQGLPTPIHTVVAGLGGRPITQASLREMIERGMRDELPSVTFLDLQTEVVERALERERASRRSGPVAEGVLKDLGVKAMQYV